MADATSATTTKTAPTEVTPIIKFNTSYLIPHGILKIIEIFICITIVCLILDRRDRGHFSGGSFFGMGVALTSFICTMIQLLFNLCAKLDKIWFVIDMVVSVLVALLHLAATACLLYVGISFLEIFPSRIFPPPYRIYAAGGVSFIAFILYILSIVSAVKARLAANKISDQA